jgi:HK97 family phage major capsid protein
MAAKGRHVESNDTLADFCRGVAGMKAKGELSLKALAAGTDATGGFLLPTAVFGNVLQAMTAESTVMTAGAKVLLLGSEGEGAKSYTFAAVSTVPTAGWRAENGAVAESDPAFRAVTVVPQSLAFYFKVSRELLADASNLDTAMRLACAQAFAKELDRTALLGTGTAPQPRGLANLSGVQAVANGATGASLGTTKYANMFTATQAILDANGPMPTAAIMSHRSRITLAQLVDTVGQPLNTPPMLQGIRQISTSQIPNNLTVSTSTDCSQMFIGDFNYLGYAMREGISVRAMEQTFASTGQIGFFCHARVDVFVTHPAVFAQVTGIRA